MSDASPVVAKEWYDRVRKASQILAKVRTYENNKTAISKSRAILQWNFIWFSKKHVYNVIQKIESSSSFSS